AEQRLTGDPATLAAELRKDLEARKKASDGIAIPTAHALSEGMGRDHPLYLLGNPKKPGEAAPRSIPAIFTGGERRAFSSKGSGRLQLAEAVASRENPLTARVMANRAWAGHFGAGIVRTPSNFGALGERPTHPELLDWLACEFAGERRGVSPTAARG